VCFLGAMRITIALSWMFLHGAKVGLLGAVLPFYFRASDTAITGVAYAAFMEGG